MSLHSFLDSVRRRTLPNGLTLLTREHRRGGVVAINTWVKAGYFHEPDDVAGMAHLFEHMFFKGSEKYPGPEEISTYVSRLGGTTNAGTIYDSTNYYFVLPREGFAKGVEIQADAIAHPLFDPAELVKEAEVVIEESNRKLDNPPALVLERMYANAFTEHRMKRWRIGSSEVLRNIRRDSLIAFFETLYRPSNIIVAVVGDVSHEEAFDAVAKAFGEIPAGSLQKAGGPPEPPQTAFRYSESFGDIRQAYSAFGWHTPGEKHPHNEALDILAAILGGGRYSRFYRAVVGPGGANAISAFNSIFEDVGLLTVHASYDSANAVPVEAGVIEEIERMKSHGPSEYELALAQNRIESSFIFDLEDVLGQAQTLLQYESRGSYLDAGEYLRRMKAVSRDEVAEVAREYLGIGNLTLTRYHPASMPSITEDVAKATIVGAMSLELRPPEAVAMPMLPASPPEAIMTRAVQRYVLSNGAMLFVREVPGTPTVNASVNFKGGRIRENSGNAGITQLMARSMRRGTLSRSAEQVDRDIEFLGTQFNIAVDDDYFAFTFDIVQSRFRAGLEILADVLLRPSFPDGGIEEERQLQIAAIRRGLDSGTERPFQLFNSAFFGPHPYGLPGSGFESSVGALGRDDLVGWYREHVRAEGCLIVIVGDVDAEAVRDLVEEQLHTMPRRDHLTRPVPNFTAPDTPRELVEVRDRRQTAIVVGFPSVPPQHPDWTALRILQDVTSGLAGTFFVELRARRSLAYTVYAADASRETAAAFVGYIASDASKEAEAREGLVREMQRLAADGITPEDLERAKSYMAGALRIRLQTNAAIARQLAHDYLFGLGLDFVDRFLERVRAASVEDLRAVAKKYLTHDNYTVAILRGRG
ncbi:MAG: M16 family metallopeptidase [Thermoanaerobaculia bacterium]